MELFHDALETTLLLLAVVTVLTLFAERIGVAYPLVLVVGGLAIAAHPLLPDVELQPELILVLFLPPLLFADALQTSWRDFRSDGRAIGSLAVGLVVATTLGVAAAVHTLVPGMPWTSAFLLGAILSPTDAVAVGAIAHHLPMPRRVLSIVQGEALVNDASGLVAYQFAVAAAVSGGFSVVAAGERFLWVVASGVGAGLFVGLIIRWMARYFTEPRIAIVMSVLSAYGAYFAAEALHGSGVLAVVAAGLFIGQQVTPRLRASVRLASGAVWETLTFLINGLVFILLGLQLTTVRSAAEGQHPGRLVLLGLVVAIATTGVRFLWVMPLGRVRMIWQRHGSPAAPPPAGERAVMAWAGMRGVVSLAVALALPITRADGSPLPYRAEILFLAFVVVVTTLLVQGLTLAPMLRRLQLASHDGAEQERAARLAITHAAIARLDGWTEEDPHAHAAELQRVLRIRADHLDEGVNGGPGDMRVLLRQVVNHQRETLLRMNEEGKVSDDVLRRLQRELDLEEERL
jgi:CPA1 family monovalent cation:H+ antiporter